MKLLNNGKRQIFTLCFLLIELILYILILTTSGTLLAACSYISIVICFFYALLQISRRNSLILGGLACTVAADYFLIVCSPIQQLWGMVFFLTAQTLYAIKLHTTGKSRKILVARVLLILFAEAAAWIILKNKTDALAVISVCYYANLIVNIVEAFTLFRENKLLPIGFVLFLLCDTIIGLQAASGVYLTIPAHSLLYRILFMDFHLSWFFYLPSQVLIALSTRTER